MSAYFDTELEEENDASTISLNNRYGSGFISSHQIFKGLTVWVYNITFQSDFKINLGLSKDRPYYFCYNVKGHFLHRFGKVEEFVKVLQNQNMIVVSSPEATVEIVFPANVKLEIAVIIVDTNLLENLEIRNAKRMHSKIQKIFQKIPNDSPYRHLGEIDSQTGKYASIICKNNVTNLIEGLLTEGAIMNMLASQLKSYNEHSLKIKTQPKLTRAELSKISSLGSYIINNMENKITLDELSKAFQLSPKKLQLGVKHLYGETVGHYISNVRMGYAKQLFLTTELNVSEVCIQIGISSQSYFSKIFKQRFGMLPSTFRTRRTT